MRWIIIITIASMLILDLIKAISDHCLELSFGHVVNGGFTRAVLQWMKSVRFTQFTAPNANRVKTPQLSITAVGYDHIRVS